MKLPKLLKKYNKHRNKTEMLKEELMSILIDIVTKIKKVDFLVDGFPLTINNDCQNFDIEYNEDEYIYLVKVLNKVDEIRYTVPVDYLNLSVNELAIEMLNRTKMHDYTRKIISVQKEIALEKWIPLLKSNKLNPDYIKKVFNSYHVFLIIYPKDGSIYNHPWVTNVEDPIWEATIVYQLKNGEAEDKSLLFKMRMFFNDLGLTEITDRYNKYLDYYFIEEVKGLQAEDFIN